MVIDQKYIRIIPRLDIKGPNLVKGIHLEGLRTLGRPEDFAAYYYKNGADELFFQDTVASLYERNNLTEVISRTAQQIFVPLTVSGGLRSLSDINDVLRAGADKVAINTAAIRNKTLISAAARMFGSSTILVSIEVIKQSNGAYLAFTDNGREHTGIELTDWLRQVEDLGAGEVLLTSIDREGTGHGFDVELMKLATSLLSIPVIAHGGGSSSEHIQEVVKEARVDAVALASMLHYPALAEVSPIPADEEGNTAFLQSGRTFSRFGSLQLHDLKRELHGFGLRIRMPADARCCHN